MIATSDMLDGAVAAIRECIEMAKSAEDEISFKSYMSEAVKWNDWYKTLLEYG